MSTAIREALAGSERQDSMGKRLAIRVLVSANLLHGAIFLKFAGAPGSGACSTSCRKRSTGWHLSRYSS